MFEQFTEQAREGMGLAVDEVGRFKHRHVDPAHLLVGLLREEEGVAAQALSICGVTLEAAQERLEAILGHGKEDVGGGTFTVRSKRVLDLAFGATRRLRDDRVDTKHLLLALASEPGGAAAEILSSDLGAGQQELRAEVLSLIDEEDSTGIVSERLGDEDSTRTLWIPGNDELDLDRPMPPKSNQLSASHGVVMPFSSILRDATARGGTTGLPRSSRTAPQPCRWRSQASPGREEASLQDDAPTDLRPSPRHLYCSPGL
jgi:Clp amino terminal domain, pathogenicity island component